MEERRGNPSLRANFQENVLSSRTVSLPGDHDDDRWKCNPKATGGICAGREIIKIQIPSLCIHKYTEIRRWSLNIDRYDKSSLRATERISSFFLAAPAIEKKYSFGAKWTF